MNDKIMNLLSEGITAQILQQPHIQLDPDEPLISGGIIDSFSLVDLALIIEDEFGIYIDDSDLDASTFDTLRELAELIRDRQM